MAFSMRAVVLEQHRGTHELEGPQAGVADQVDQRDPVPAQADLGDDEADLRDRGERQGALDVGLGAGRQRAVERR